METKMMEMTREDAVICGVVRELMTICRKADSQEQSLRNHLGDRAKGVALTVSMAIRDALVSKLGELGLPPIDVSRAVVYSGDQKIGLLDIEVHNRRLVKLAD